MEIVERLRGAGYEALWAGGCVRDQLLGIPAKDYDVATSARPEQIREVFGHRRTLPLGAAFGVISVLGGRSREPIEVATFRCDGTYVDGRHPEEVVFTTAEADASRRDFTINGLFFDPFKEEVVDYVDGVKDLQRKLIRAIGDPTARLAEDKLRMLRAVRFATTLGFQIEDATLAAIQPMAKEVLVVSAERIGAELRRVLTHTRRSHGLELLRESELLAPLLPEIAARADRDELPWKRLVDRMRALSTESISVALAALAWESGDAELVRVLGGRFRFTNKEVDQAVWLVEHLPTVGEAKVVPWPRLQRVLVHEGAAELLALASAVFGAEDPGLLHCRDRLALPADDLNPPSLLTGDDLIAHGLDPGPYFGPLLEHVRDEQLEGRINSREQGLAVVERWLREQAQQ